MQKNLLLFTSLLLICFNLHAQTGTLDPTFGIGGRLKTNFTSGSATTSEQAFASAVQADGKLLVVTSSSIFMVIRYHTDGTIDNTFDGDGFAGLPGFTPTSIVAGSDGKIVVGGYVGGFNNDCAIIRLNSDGTPDNTFDGDGRAVTAVSASFNDQFNAVAIQADGKIVAAGFSYNGLNNDWSVIRYNTNGSLDNTFDGDGQMTTSFGTGNDVARAVAIQGDGKIVAAGNGYTASPDCALARFNTDGSLDNTFDGDGKVITSINASNNEDLTSLVIQSDGKIVAGGHAVLALYYDMLLLRYNSNGVLDAAFDTDGILTTPVGLANDYVSSIALQADGKIVAAGYYNNGLSNDSYTARVNTDGTLDNSYDGDGKRPIALSAQNDRYVGVTMQSGKIATLGYGVIGGVNRFIINRYDSDGALDNTLNSTGHVISSGFGGSNDVIGGLAVQSDGKIVVVGTTTTTDADWLVARYNTDGSADNTFDGDGRLITALSADPDNAFAVAVQPDGKIVVGGFITNGGAINFALVRYNTNGTLDNTFSGDGIETTAVGSSSSQISALVIQPDGKIVVAGFGTNLGDAEFAVARYNTDGSLDTGFDGDGIALTPISSGTDEAYAIALQADGKIVATGYSDLGFSTVRYNANGSLDVTFDNDGIQTTALATTADRAYSVAIQADGKIVLAGVAYPANSVFAVVRYNTTDGSLDNTFDGDGILTTAVGPLGDQASSVNIQSDGKIVVAGLATNNNFNTDFAVARYNENGSLDNTFGAGGIGIYDLFTGANDQIMAAKLASNRLYAGGSVGTETGLDLALAAIATAAGPLPLQLLSFTGNTTNGAAHLIWETTNERNTLEFVIERSLDGIVYTDAGTVPSANNPGNHAYTFTDPNIGKLNTKKLYYRLKQKDMDGRFTYSGIVTLSLTVNASIVRLTPNPVEGSANLMINTTVRETITYLIIDSKGSIVKTVKTVLQLGSNKITINMTGLRSGTYTLDVKGTVTNEQLRFLKR